MKEHLTERLNEVQYYLDMVTEHLKLDQPDDAEGWAKVLIEEAEKLQKACEREAKKKAKAV